MQKALSGKIDFRNDYLSNLNALIGKVSFTEDQFINNFDTFMKTINSKRSERFKGKYYLRVYLKSSEGPAFRLHHQLVDPRDENYFMNSLKKYRKFDIRSTLQVDEQIIEKQRLKI